ncbi:MULTISPECIES: ImmA/IrrE family metallo-endopeptidase [Streptomyces]|uniref:ImmA/IrrE family metallo-endopeptidase n=1 Tax=Streptomyces TaxID=1883 RepID=UPI0004CD4706|nr:MULTISPECIES: ImmA/IrrE family metallo-endopeptidase [Streptomyces]KOT65820.1 hypothetical protein ADK43_02540 [Streptomyces rimosus subsp. rimosus]
MGELTPLLEANGVRVSAPPPDCADVGAFSTRHPGTPFVFLPPDLTGEQARQHLAHELGQLVLGYSRPGIRDSYVASARFVSAFLIRGLPVDSFTELTALCVAEPPCWPAAAVGSEGSADVVHGPDTRALDTIDGPRQE